MLKNISMPLHITVFVECRQVVAHPSPTLRQCLLQNCKMKQKSVGKYLWSPNHTGNGCDLFTQIGLASPVSPHEKITYIKKDYPVVISCFIRARLKFHAPWKSGIFHDILHIYPLDLIMQQCIYVEGKTNNVFGQIIWPGTLVLVATFILLNSAAEVTVCYWDQQTQNGIKTCC